jgi:hypothetical protein
MNWFTASANSPAIRALFAALVRTSAAMWRRSIARGAGGAPLPLNATVREQGGYMINRREFLEAAAVCALPASAGARPRADDRPTGASRPALPFVLIDERHAQARTVGACLTAAGAPVRAIRGDVTRVWLDHIGPAWRHRPLTVAGLTARPALFCLEQFAFGCGLRVVFHAEHVVHRQGRTEHRLLRGAQAAGVSARDLDLAGPLWPARIAEAIAAHAGQTDGERFGPSDAALSPVVPAEAQLLTSWIIAAA